MTQSFEHLAIKILVDKLEEKLGREATPHDLEAYITPVAVRNYIVLNFMDYYGDWDSPEAS